MGSIISDDAANRLQCHLSEKDDESEASQETSPKVQLGKRQRPEQAATVFEKMQLRKKQKTDYARMINPTRGPTSSKEPEHDLCLEQ